MMKSGRQLMRYCLMLFASMVCMPALQAQNNDYLQWLQQQQQGVYQQQQAFQAYKDERDREFTAFLKAQWTAVELLKGKRRDETPKPREIPVARSQPPVRVIPESPDQVIDQQSEQDEPLAKPEPDESAAPAPLSVKPPSPAPLIANPRGRQIDIDYYGQKLTFYYDPRLDRNLHARIDKNTISDYWSALSHADYEPLLGQLTDQKKVLMLTDWAYAALIDKVSHSINPGGNESALLSWFLLIKSGYKARVAYNDQSVYLLVPSMQELFEVPYFTFSGKRFYVVSFDGRKKRPGQVFTYDAEYPGTIHELDMKVTPVVAANNQQEHRHLSFKFQGKEYTVDAIYDRGRIEFFRTYPQMTLPLYFTSGVEPETATPLQKQLATYIKDMNEQQAVNFLLRFVQTALRYKTDKQQFGEENYLFPEETLFYPYSDCEDRAVLFAWLVKSLLGLDVIGLDYPGHVATAVNFKADVAGDTILYRGRKYSVADPTYINANAGMTMPDYKHKKPEIIAY